jgi:putative phosphoesterase
MQEVLIFSDSHGKADTMCRVIEAHPAATHILFCGDGLRDVAFLEEQYPKRIFHAVSGNCDLFASLDGATFEKLVFLGGLRVLLMHGHLHGVKGGYGAAAAYAHRNGADILVFGHTHIPYEGRHAVGEGSVHLFNPGSIGAGGREGSRFGYLDIRNGQVVSNCAVYEE